MKTTKFQFRTTEQERARWRAAAALREQDESKFARDALDAWVEICQEAARLGMTPSDLLARALLALTPNRHRR